MGWSEFTSASSSNTWQLLFSSSLKGISPQVNFIFGADLRNKVPHTLPNTNRVKSKVHTDIAASTHGTGFWIVKKQVFFYYLICSKNLLACLNILIAFSTIRSYSNWRNPLEMKCLTKYLSRLQKLSNLTYLFCHILSKPMRPNKVHVNWYDRLKCYQHIFSHVTYTLL